ncbi:MAG: T9SS type A sorting domain-containing protein [Ginsengibacter sp.]
MNAAQLFYRIQQVDMDGNNTWSPVITIKVSEQKGISVYPNPVKKVTSPVVYILNNEKVWSQLYSTSGQLIMQQQLKAGNNILKMRPGTSGWFVLRLLFSDGTIQRTKILIE